MALARVRGLFGGGPGRVRQNHAWHRIHYCADLVAELKADHSELLGLHRELENLAITGRYAGIAGALHAFKDKFDQHLLTENVRFYCYVEERLSRRPAELQKIKSFRVEVNAIARQITGFVRKYWAEGVRFTNGKEFLDELRRVGALLVQRIEREEKDLYPLYSH